MAEQGIELSLNIEPPLKEFDFAFTRWADSVDDMSTLFPILSGLFKSEMRAQFASEGAASGGRWTDLSTAYADWKDKHYPGRPTGVLRGYLRAAMTGGDGYTERFERRSAEFGQSDSAQSAPYGGHFAARRPVLRMAQFWGRDWQKATHEWLLAGTRANFSEGGRAGWKDWKTFDLSGEIARSRP